MGMVPVAVGTGGEGPRGVRMGAGAGGSGGGRNSRPPIKAWPRLAHLATVSSSSAPALPSLILILILVLPLLPPPPHRPRPLSRPTLSPLFLSTPAPPLSPVPFSSQWAASSLQASTMRPRPVSTPSHSRPSLSLHLLPSHPPFPQATMRLRTRSSATA